MVYHNMHHSHHRYSVFQTQIPHKSSRITCQCTHCCLGKPCPRHPTQCQGTAHRVQKTSGPTAHATTFQQNSQATAEHSCTTPTGHQPRPTSKGAHTYATHPTLPIVSDDEDSDDKHEPPPRVLTHHAVPLVPHPQPTTTTPALNTCSRVRSLTYEAMLHILSTHHNSITAS